MEQHQNIIGTKSLLSLSLPLMVELLLIALIGLIDIWFLSQISDAAAAAVGNTVFVLGLVMTVFSIFSFAGNSIAAQRLGAKAYHELAQTYGAMYVISFLVGLVISILLILASQEIPVYLGLDTNMASMASTYLLTLSAGCVLLSLRFCVAAILTSQGYVGWVVLGTTIIVLSNLFFNSLFVFGFWGAPKLGVFGVALATTISWALSLLFFIYVQFFKLKVRVKFRQSFPTFSEISKPILRIANPMVLEPIFLHLAQFVIISVIIVSLGESMLAMRAYLINLSFLTTVFTAAISIAVVLKVAYHLGSANVDDADRQLNIGLRYSLVCTLVIYIPLIAFSEFVLEFFTNDPAILRIGKTIFILDFLSKLGACLNYVAGGSLKATGDVRFVLIVSILSWWVLLLPVAWILGIYFGFGFIGVGIAVVIQELFSGLVVLLRWKRRSIVMRKVSPLDHSNNPSVANAL